MVPEQKLPLVLIEEPRPPEQVLLTVQLFVGQEQALHPPQEFLLLHVACPEQTVPLHVHFPHVPEVAPQEQVLA